MSDKAALWGFLALPLAIIIGAPSLGQLILLIRDSGKSARELYDILRASDGRVRGLTVVNRLASSASYYPIEVSGLPDFRRDPIEGVRLVLAEGGRVLLSAPAGAGKTRMLEELHKRSYLVSESLKDPLIEVVSLADYSNGLRRQPLLNWASRSIGRRYGLSWRSVRKLVTEALVIVAFDGIDEVSNTTRTLVAGAIAAHAETHPTIVTMRVGGEGSESRTDVNDWLPRLHGLTKARIEPLAWAQSLAAIRKAGISAQALSERPTTRQFFCNPLHLQLILAAWEIKLVSPSDLLGLARNPSNIWSYFLDALCSEQDRPLHLAGLLSADHTGTPGSTFRVFPVQLAGLAFTVTRILGVAAALLLGWHVFPTTSIVVTVAILFTSVYPNATFIGRLSSRFSGKIRGWVPELLSVATIFALVHLIRAAVWSVTAGKLALGPPRLLIDSYWLSAAGFLWMFIHLSPLGLDTAIHTWTARSQERAWPSFALLVGAAIWYRSAQSSVLAFWCLAYFGTVCIYLTVSMVLASVIAGAPPWRWSTQLSSLVQFGVLARAGSVYRFTHTRVQQRVLLRLADDTLGSGLLWRSFGAHWPDALFRGDSSAFWRAGATLDRAVHLLQARSAWSTSCVNAAVAYFQWMSIDPAAASRLMRKHMRLLPRSSISPCDMDARDRIGDRKGLERARECLGRPGISLYHIHWCFRVLERHLSRDDLLEQACALARIHSGKRHFSSYLNRLSMRLAGDDVDCTFSGEVHERLLRAELLLETPTADLDAVDRLLSGLPPVSRVHAKRSQLAHLRGDSDLARAEAIQALDQVELWIGYPGALEVMLTAAVLAQDTDATAWVERALETGMRLRFRDGLMRTLDISEDANVATLFEDPPLESTH